MYRRLYSRIRETNKDFIYLFLTDEEEKYLEKSGIFCYFSKIGSSTKEQNKFLINAEGIRHKYCNC